MIGDAIVEIDAPQIIDGEKADATPLIDVSREVLTISPSTRIEVSSDTGSLDEYEIRSKVGELPGGDLGGFDVNADHRGEEIVKAQIDEDSEERWMNGFQVGDMVWGKVKSHPWWPGHIFDDAFATPSVRKTKREGHVLVAFFGDSSYGWFDPAELIPFEPHYSEKSKQVTSKNFTKAVDEAVDEASRRSALGVSCPCHDLLKIQPISIPGYFSVDVAGFESGGLYSSKQIIDAREIFLPFKALSFLKQAAEVPLDSDVWSLEGAKQASILLAIRRGLFEKFDRTYAEAFGGSASRNSLDVQGGVEQAGRVQSRAAPLSGPMVIAEPLGERHVVQAPVKKTSSKHLLKKREDPLGQDSVNLKKAPDDQAPTPAAVEKAAADAAAAATVEALAAAHQRMMMSAPENGVAAKKKKRKRDPGLIQPPPPSKKIATAPPSIAQSLPKFDVTSPLPSATQPPPKLDLPATLDVDLQTVLSELTLLAVDPFRSAAISVRRVFLSFRALVFEKGLPFPPPKEYEPFLIRKGGAAAEDQKAAAVAPPPPPSKPRKAAPPSFRADDPTKAGRKRLAAPDRADDKMTKKLKKSTFPAPEKKIAPQPKPEPPVKKQEAAPTFLIMRFPQRTTLPSISSLKARFARFGPLDLSGTRVFWKSYTCKVLFKHKADAQAALSYAQSNEIFGQIKVSYSLRDPDVPEMPAPPKPSQTHPKSILKKPAEEGGTAKETQRVKFLLGEPPVVVCTAASQEIPNRKSSTSSNSVSSLPTSDDRDVDFSRQMLSLLTRCNDIVTDVKSALGYVPYHPL